MSRSSEPSGDGDSGSNAPGDPRATRSGARWAARSRLRPLGNRARLHDRLRISSSGSLIARGSATVTNTSRSTTAARSGAAPRGSARPRTSWKRCAGEPPSPRRMSHRRMIPFGGTRAEEVFEGSSCGRKLGVFCDGASECSVEADWLDVEQRHSGGVGDDRWHGEPFDQWSRDPGVDGCDEPDPQR